VRVALAAGVVVLVALLARREGGGGSWARPGAEPWLWLSSFAVFAAASLVVLLWPLGRPGVSRPAVWAVLASSLALPLAHALSSEEASQFGSVSGVVRGALGCFVYGFGLALPFVGLVLLMDRSDRLTARGLALVAGAGALVANLGLLLHCALDHQPHLLAGHAPIGLAFLLGLFTVRAVAVRR
jgi:hypothetical protein